MALVGNTIKLKGRFTDFEGVVAPATNVSFTIYDTTGELDIIDVDLPNDENEYEANYIVPEGSGSFKVKLYGLIDGYPEVGIISITREQ